jgi:hypothetical protein
MKTIKVFVKRWGGWLLILSISGLFTFWPLKAIGAPILAWASVTAGFTLAVCAGFWIKVN